MADVHNETVRSYNMSRIKAKDTSPEMLVRKYLFSKGFRFRLHDKFLPGKPDIILLKYRVIVFVNGCFWHGHEDCRYFVIPKTRTDWWINKITLNKKNDQTVRERLETMGWKVLDVWECDLKKQKRERTLENLRTLIKADK